MCYPEDEAYIIWSRMITNKKERYKVMKELFALNSTAEAKAYDEKFAERRRMTVYKNSHPLECSRVVL